MVQINGVRTTKNIQQDRRVVDMAKDIALLDPNESPFVTFLKLAKSGTRTVYNPEFKWLEDELTANQADLKTTIASTATTSVELKTGQGAYFRVGDVIHIPSVGENMLVTAITTDTLTVTRGYGTTSAVGTIAANSAIFKIGTAMMENSSVPAIITTQATSQGNYTQIFRTPFALSNTEAASKLYGGKDRAYQRRKASIEHKRDIAMAMYFGQKKEDTTGTTVRRTMAGLDYFMPAASATFSSGSVDLTYANFDAIVARKAFAHGSSEKLLICGPKLATAINVWAVKKLVTKVDPSASYGMRMQDLVTSYGDFKVIYDPLLADGVHDGYGYVVDPANIRYCALDGRDTKLYTNIQANDTDGIIDEYLTECSLEVKQPSTHLRITGCYDIAE